ncbi:MAG: hypothetical protein AB8G86_27295 [Saprospiraceae bacterium]
MPINTNQTKLGLLLLTLLFCSACQTERTNEEITSEMPTSFLLDLSDLPDYEQNIDHARLIANESNEFYHKGQIVYRNVCFIPFPS